MRIAICDDEPRELELLHSFLLRYDATLPYTLFSSAQDLLDASSSTFFDIIFMDIEMRSPNGYDAAVSLMQNETRPLIIFVTKSSSYTILGYGVAFRYLKKPISYDAFSAVLKLALEEVVPQKLPITANGETILLAIQDIYYFEIFGHVLQVHTTRGVYPYRASLSDVISVLNGTHFAQPHKSFYVNLAYIDQLNARRLFLTTGTKIPIASLRKNEFMQAFQAFLRSR